MAKVYTEEVDIERVEKWTLKAQKWTFEINYFLSQIRFQKKQ